MHQAWKYPEEHGGRNRDPKGRISRDLVKVDLELGDELRQESCKKDQDKDAGCDSI